MPSTPKRIRRVSPDVRLERAKRRRVQTLARRVARWEHELRLLRANPHPSPGRHAQRLSTIDWHLVMLRADRDALARELGA